MRESTYTGAYGWEIVRERMRERERERERKREREKKKEGKAKYQREKRLDSSGEKEWIG
jgi:hypothetical protein